MRVACGDGLILVGLRGVGKTVLLFRIREEAQAAGYKALMVEAPEDRTLAEILLPPLRQILLALDAIISICSG